MFLSSCVVLYLNGFELWPCFNWDISVYNCMTLVPKMRRSKRNKKEELVQTMSIAEELNPFVALSVSQS